MSRFFVTPDQIDGGTVKITGDDAKHIAKVLRMEKGDFLELCDGESNEYIARIELIEQGTVTLFIAGRLDAPSEPPYRVTLFQCLPKSDKMELIIQKCVELGVYEIVPIMSNRCVVKLDKKGAASKHRRYERIAYEAAKQCKRGIVPRVLEVCELSKVDFSGFDAVIVPYECETERTLKRCLKDIHDAKRIAVVIGSEGGFEKGEVEGIISKGGISVTLGKRILRTETAGMAVLAMINYEMEG